tara:strand:+ start:706 stop:969 length:264 start_codon:yes stop_codon:yes gene_type:complete
MNIGILIKNECDENQRLIKLNSEEPASTLFRDEAYKWENFYQSILRKIISRDKSSIKGLLVFIIITVKEKDIVLKSLDSLLDWHIIY